MDFASVSFGAIAAILVERGIYAVINMYNTFIENDRKRTEMCDRAVREMQEMVTKALAEHKQFVSDKTDMITEYGRSLESKGYITSETVDLVNEVVLSRADGRYKKFMKDISERPAITTSITDLPEIVNTNMKISGVNSIGEDDCKFYAM